MPEAASAHQDARALRTEIATARFRISKPHHKQDRYGVKWQDRDFVTGYIIDEGDRGGKGKGLDE